jgi:hypothetical protein
MDTDKRGLEDFASQVANIASPPCEETNRRQYISHTPAAGMQLQQRAVYRTAYQMYILAGRTRWLDRVQLPNRMRAPGYFAARQGCHRFAYGNFIELQLIGHDASLAATLTPKECTLPGH